MRHETEIFRIIDSLDGPFKDHVVRKIKIYKNECGCKLGGIFAVFAITICIFYFVLFFNPISVFATIKTMAVCVMMIMIAALVGKGIGIGISRIQLRLLYRKVLNAHH